MQHIKYKGITINYNPISKLYYATVTTDDVLNPKILLSEKSKLLNYLKLKIDWYLKEV